MENFKELDEIVKDKDVLIFDFDGTMANTEKFHWLAHEQILKPFNVVLTQQDIDKYMGNPDKNIVKFYERDFNVKFEEKDFIKRRTDIFSDLAINNNLQPFKYFKYLVENYKHKKKFYILSAQVGFVLEKFVKHWGLEETFVKVYSAVDLNIAKDELLKQINKNFNCDYSNAVLFEDVNKYIKIAKSYGLKTVGVEHIHNKGKLLDSDLVIKTIK